MEDADVKKDVGVALDVDAVGEFVVVFVFVFVVVVVVSSSTGTALPASSTLKVLVTEKKSSAFFKFRNEFVASSSVVVVVVVVVVFIIVVVGVSAPHPEQIVTPLNLLEAPLTFLEISPPPSSLIEVSTVAPDSMETERCVFIRKQAPLPLPPPLNRRPAPGDSLIFRTESVVMPSSKLPSATPPRTTPVSMVKLTTPPLEKLRPDVPESP